MLAALETVRPILKDTGIYCTAEKYGLPQLKRLALRKQGLQAGIPVSTILASARYAYAHTPESDSKTESSLSPLDYSKPGYIQKKAARCRWRWEWYLQPRVPRFRVPLSEQGFGSISSWPCATTCELCRVYIGWHHTDGCKIGTTWRRLQNRHALQTRHSPLLLLQIPSGISARPRTQHKNLLHLTSYSNCLHYVPFTLAASFAPLVPLEAGLYLFSSFLPCSFYTSSIPHQFVQQTTIENYTLNFAERRSICMRMCVLTQALKEADWHKCTIIALEFFSLSDAWVGFQF